MKFNLNISVPTSSIKMTHNESILLMGSCFTENIGNYLLNSKFDCCINPHGILFNPISIAHAIDSYLNSEKINDHSLIFHNELWHSFNHHGCFSNSDKSTIIDTINNHIETGSKYLKNAKWLVITFGSAYGYRHLESNAIVANCHKLPNTLFNKELISSNTIIETYINVLEKIKNNNPNINILLTVSPVKHLRDGIIENSLSKAILIQSVHSIIQQLSFCHYFPAYELVTEDLRDYRFYKEDMAHPNEQAIEYVWQKFSQSFFNESTLEIIKEINIIKNAYSHRPINVNSEEHRRFLANFLIKHIELQSKYPYLNFDEEKNYFNTVLQKPTPPL